MKNISTTYIAGIVSVIVFVLPLIGLDVADNGTLTNTVTSIVGAIGAIWVFVGRYRAGGISALGIKKKEDK